MSCCVVFLGSVESCELDSEKSAVGLLRDSGTKDNLWRSSRESDVSALWDSCRILFIQLNCMNVLQTLELASCLLWPVQLVKLASSSFSQKTHMVGGFPLRLLSVLCLLYLSALCLQARLVVLPEEMCSLFTCSFKKLEC